MLQGCYKIRTPENQPPEPSMKSKTAVHIPGTSHPQQSHVRTPRYSRSFLHFIGWCCWCCCCSPRWLLWNLRWLGSISIVFLIVKDCYQMTDQEWSGLVLTYSKYVLGIFCLKDLLKHTQCISMLMYNNVYMSLYVNVNVTMICNDAIKSQPLKAH